ncbi:MAG: nucleotide pyrophosphohydrolase [Ruminococcaceae bacterium]|nr:nucleotide pyrophosphohydrolase [Oscillospiraceae bacterium]
MKLSIEDLQAYLFDHYGGWATEQSMFMKLVEEIGEVAEVLNKRAGRKATDEEDLQEQLGAELADMIHYIVAIAAINDINLARIIVEKDRKASVKYKHKTNFETFLFTQNHT